MKKHVIFAAAVILFTSCTQNDKEQKLKKEDISFSLLIEDEEINHEISLLNIYKVLRFDEIPRTVPYGENRIERFANLILKDSIPVLHTLPVEYLPFDTITWEENPQNNTTWQLYFENLFFVSVLNHHYQNSKDISYHNQAKRYVQSYIDVHKSLEVNTSNYSWSDHSVAFRTLHILQTVCNELSLQDPDLQFIERSFNHINHNVSFMVNPKNYRVHNHSLMMDRSLLYLSKITSANIEFSKQIKRIASTRALASFDQIIDDSGLAKEHSTTYHILNHNLYKSIFNLVGKNDLSPKILEKRKDRVDVFFQLLKPDKTFINWGDSQEEILSDSFIEKFEDEGQKLRNALNGGDLSSSVSFQNNIATLRSNVTDISQVTLFANYYNKVHKHNDDLSFIYYTLGTNILTDQGYFGYDKVYRPFLTSTFAHNGIAINDSNYEIKYGSSQKASLCNYVEHKDYEIIEAEHTMYDSITVSRKLLYIKPNIIILKDSSFSKENKVINTIGQQFNLGEDAKRITIDKNTAAVDFGNDVTLLIKSLDQKAQITEENSFYSKRPNKIEPRKQIKVLQKNNFSTTVLEVVSKNYMNPVSKITIKGKQIIFTKNGTINNLFW
jgi:hypothetical protein